MAATVQRATRDIRARVLIVDDHPIFRQGIAQIVHQSGDFEICGEADCPEKAMQSTATLQPDVAVVDLAFSSGSGLELVRDLKVWHPSVRILVLSMHDESLYAERVLRAGASGYIMKHEIAEHFIEAIHQVLRGSVYLSERMAARMLQRLAGREPTTVASSVESLSDRELDIYQMVGQCLSTREVADRLCLSIKTVETHLGHVKVKLGLESSRELFRHAVVSSLKGC